MLQGKPVEFSDFHRFTAIYCSKRKPFFLGEGDVVTDGKLVVVVYDVLDAVLSTDLGAQRCFKFLTRQLIALITEGQNY